MEEFLLSTIDKHQNDDGAIVSYSSSRKISSCERPRETTFFTSLVLDLLSDVKGPSESIAKKADSFLLKQRSSNWTWNYWSRESKDNDSFPYPDDADDTFCALSALYRRNKNNISGKSLAKIIHGLTSIESQVGGPYFTWYTSTTDKVWKDIDLAVNTNIGYFLSQHDIQLPHLTELIESAIQSHRYSSPYYVGDLPSLYFISRWYRGKYTDMCIRHILSQQRKDTTWGNQFQTALAVKSLYNFGYALKNNPLNTYNKKDFEKAYAFCLDPKENMKIQYAGSPALTSALYLSILHKEEKDQNTSITGVNAFYGTVVNSVLDSISAHFGKKASDTVSNIIKHDADKQMVLLPKIFNSCLKISLKDDPLIKKLCTAHLFGWIAYTLYDNFLDDEAQPQELPVAHFCNRELRTIYEESLGKDFTKKYDDIMLRMDVANFWEVSQARSKHSVPDYKNVSIIAEKSIGHMLCVFAIMHKTKTPEESKDWKNIENYFIHYITARQLSDDAHDWETDLKNEHITPVVAMLLEASSSASAHSGKSYQETFWESVIDDVCSEIEEHLNIAQEALEEVTCLHSKIPFKKALDSLRKVVKQTLHERDNALEFIQNV